MASKFVSSLDMSVDDIDRNEPFQIEENISQEQLLLDIEAITSIDWNDDVFSDVNNTSKFSVQDHSTEFQGNYNFSKDMLETLHNKFGLEHFRDKQREIINCILCGHDCFVLMPTGGGKSLCYQLPAILSKGVTIVISPLIALISDQVEKLNSLDIRAAHLCSNLTRLKTEEVVSKLYLTDPEIDLLYLTPERIMGSEKVRNLLNSLYKRGKLSRFVMDEVHCLSLWGHDFRPHYKQLSDLRQKYGDIQIVCFTATATKQVETDIIVNLKLSNVKRFIQSFNRPNIKYQVFDKSEKMPVNEIITIIRQKFYKKSGIIYCLTRKDCVILSFWLRYAGILAKPYHAGLENKVREITQREWMQNKFHVIVATTAFGMGIDKPDVRFVIHNTIPKSLETYYQESGRAGRDGEISYSYLFYNYGDVLRTIRLMKDDFSNKNTLEGHNDNLEQMVNFANNQIDCRRYLQLLNLGEDFDRQLCIQNKEAACDNCENFKDGIENVIDITKRAKELSILVRDISKNCNITLNVAMKIYKGSREKYIIGKGFHWHRYYGAGRLMTRLDVHRILRDLIRRNVLANKYITTGNFPIVYVTSGLELQSFLDSTEVKVTIPVAYKRSVEVKISSTESSLSALMKTGLSASAANIQYFTSKIKGRCYENLLDLCHKLALEKNSCLTSVLHPLAIKSIAQVLPKNQDELLKIQHVTTAIYNKFGEQILRVINYFREQIQSLQEEILSNDQTSNTNLVGNNSPSKRTFSEAFSSCDKSCNNDI